MKKYFLALVFGIQIIFFKEIVGDIGYYSYLVQFALFILALVLFEISIKEENRKESINITN